VRKSICFALIWISIIVASFFGDLAYHDEIPEHIALIILGICVIVMSLSYIVGEFWESED